MPATPTLRPPLEERVLDAAERLLGRLGYQRTTMDELAREAGVGRRTIYLRFAGKEEVFLASIERVIARLLAELERIAAEPRPAPERLRDLLVARVLVRFDRVHDYHGSLEEMLSVLRPRYLERRERHFAAEAALLARVLAEGARAGELEPGDPAAVARTLVLATNSLIPSSLTTRELGSRADVERRVREIAELALRGLLPRAEERPSAARSR